MNFCLVLVLLCYIELGFSTLIPQPTRIVVTQNKTSSLNDTLTLTFSSPCNTARQIFVSEKLNEEDIYAKKQSGIALRVCESEETCCSQKAVIALTKLSETKLADVTVPLHKKLQERYGDTGATFKHLFRKILDKSYTNLDTMFQRTYKSRYENNSHVFKTLYKSLHQYFNGSELDLQSRVDTFFEKLFEKIYVMSQPWSEFDKKYENCIFESTNYVKPFGDIQRKVAHQIIRSFLASRVFLVGLKEGLDVATKLLQLPMLDQCSKAFMKMTQCSVCGGVPRSVRPCRKYCVNVIKGCYIDTTIVQTMWNKFIEAMISLTTKIEGPFSMEAVIEPLGVKISEAIMAFQENQQNITQKVIERCGTPKIRTDMGVPYGRKRRSMDGMSELKYETKRIADEFKSDTQKVINGLKPDTAASTVSFLYNINVNNQKAPTKFEKMLRETKSSLGDLKDYWVKLSDNWCSENAASVDTECWNGKNTSGYTHAVVNDLVKDYHNNPEIKYDLKPNNKFILDQVNILHRNLKLVNSALNGNAVVCDDADCDQGSGSGVGEQLEGSGSGVEPTSDPKTDEAGSGQPPEIPTTPSQSNCENSVRDDCVETITKKTKTDIDSNSIHHVPVYDQNPLASTYSAGCMSYANVLLLTACCWLTQLFVL